jgi:hypothetical protein
MEPTKSQNITVIGRRSAASGRAKDCATKAGLFDDEVHTKRCRA